MTIVFLVFSMIAAIPYFIYHVLGAKPLMALRKTLKMIWIAVVIGFALDIILACTAAMHMYNY